MLKTSLYTSLAVLGVIAALANPLAGAVAVIESYFCHPIVFNPSLANYRIQFWITAAFILGVMMHNPRPLTRVGSEGAVLWALVLYGILALASSSWAAARPDLSYNKAFDLCKTILVTLLFFRVLNSERAVKVVVWAILIGGAHAAFMHTIGANLSWVPHRYSEEFGVVPDYQGSVMVFLVPAFILFAVYGANWKEKLFCWLSLPLVLDSVINTYQRGFFVALTGQMVCLVFFLPKRIVLKLAPVGVVGAGLVLAVFTPDTFWDWMGTIQNYQEESSASSRIDIAKASWQMLQDFPLGVGYHNYMFVSPTYLDSRLLTALPSGEFVRSPHNSFFDVACCTGVVGIFLFVCSIGGSCWLLRRIRKQSDPRNITQLQLVAMALEIGFYGWAIGGLFHSTHEDETIYWAVAITVALVRLCRPTRRTPDGN